MPSCVNFCNIKLFADESFAYQQIRSLVDSVNLLSDLSNLSVWTDTWQMSFNVSKWEYMRIERLPRNITPASHTFNNSALSQVSAIKNLSINIDSHLSFDLHIREICKKTTRTLHIPNEEPKKGRNQSPIKLFVDPSLNMLHILGHLTS